MKIRKVTQVQYWLKSKDKIGELKETYGFQEPDKSTQIIDTEIVDDDLIYT